MMLRRLVSLALLLVLTVGPVAAQDAAPRRPSPIAGVRSWGYQLQKADPEVVARSNYDLVVVDYARAGTDEGRFGIDDVRRMQTKPDGSRRFVLAYLSIGEAESYRFYWNDAWVETLKVEARADTEDASRGRGGLGFRTLHFPKLGAPPWLGRENESWKGNYLVRYWDKGWQDIVFGSPKSYLDRILAAGFDGVYLDRVDAYYAVADDRATARREMVRFVERIAKYARKARPEFAIVPQNAEELLRDRTYLTEIDGIAKEDFLFGHPDENLRNAPAVIATTAKALDYALEAKLPVLIVEYVSHRESAEKLKTEIQGLGMIPYFGVRSLDRMLTIDDLRPGTVPGSSPPAEKQKATGSVAPKKKSQSARQ